MTLLAFMPNADAPPPACATLPELMHVIGERFPSALLMPAAVVAPSTTRPWAAQDWLTLPSSMRAPERATLLATAARWFEATVVLFLGSGTQREYEAFVAPAGCSKFHWDDVTWWSGPERMRGEDFSTPLLAILEARLPLICAANELAREAPTYRQSRSAGCPLWVYVRKPLTQAEADAVFSFAQQHPSCLHLKVSLRNGLGAAAGIRQLRRLLKADPPLQFTVLAENTWFAAAADAMTKLLARGAGARVQAICARRV